MREKDLQWGWQVDYKTSLRVTWPLKMAHSWSAFLHLCYKFTIFNWNGMITIIIIIITIIIAWNTLPWVMGARHVPIERHPIAETECFKFYKQRLVIWWEVRVRPSNDLVFLDVLLTDWPKDPNGNQQVGSEIDVINHSSEWVCEVAVGHLLLRVGAFQLKAMGQVSRFFTILPIAEAWQEPFILHVQEISMVTSHPSLLQEFHYSWVW